MLDSLLMALTDRRLQHADSLARTVADASAEAVAARVVGRTSRMTLCETRGYIRARSAPEIRRQTRRELGGSLAGPLPTLVVRRATDRVVPLVLRRLAAASSPVVVRRQAA